MQPGMQPQPGMMPMMGAPMMGSPMMSPMMPGGPMVMNPAMGVPVAGGAPGMQSMPPMASFTPVHPTQSSGQASVPQAMPVNPTQAPPFGNVNPDVIRCVKTQNMQELQMILAGRPNLNETDDVGYV